MPDFQIGGRLVHLETTNVIDRLRGVAPEAIEVHAVMIEGRPYPVVQALEVASGVPRGLTRSVRARHVLGSLGFVLVELRGSSPPARSGPTSPRPTIAEPIASAVDLSTVLNRLSSDRAPLPEVIAGRSSLRLDGYGIYAIYGNERTWAALGVAPFDDRPLYVGKAESGTLLTRDIKTHFATGRTGSSTVRRSFAAMLHDDLGLTGVPRNPDRPADFANFGLSTADDETLTAWMLDHLDLATWVAPPGVGIREIEQAALHACLPVLNIADCPGPWRDLVRTKRSVLATEARACTGTGLDLAPHRSPEAGRRSVED